MEDIIFKRRSIRLFKKQEIPEEILRKILLAGMWAPSPKNRQPWKMIAALGKSKEIMLSLMKEGIDRAERGEGIITGSKEYIANARYTMKCMAAAPVTVFITHPEGRSLREDWSAAEKIHELSDVQSIGAAAENMALIAAEMGIGSLWNGNIFFAYDELKKLAGCGRNGACHELRLSGASSVPAEPEKRRGCHRDPAVRRAGGKVYFL